jgi:soluble lytic murein transglycosylase-like protein
VIAWAGKSHGLSPGLVKAVIHAESAFDPGAISSKGAQGLMQLMPGTARQLGVDDPFNPWQNIEAGVRYLSSLIERFDGDLSLGLAAYHAGERTVRRYSGIPPYRETRNYVRRVLTLHRRYDADFR